ncbi:hypothetical protein DYB36_009860 [Aphanomyces astaci]|uniref:Serine/threonine specific protein phosphatases domain-containing protein n=1 Tax=Aphanomyces astaci TaxID=112090 RepID=A0A397A151_APHAT|nr:hypothetical protein DYB36_009860 [Aphanomyces astaci]
MWNSKRFFQCKLNRGMFVRKDQVEFKTLVLTQTWNTLDNHQEQLNLKRAEQTKSACDALSILAKELVLSKPPLPRTLSELPTTYDGPELHWPLTLPNVLSMMEHFKLGHGQQASVRGAGVEFGEDVTNEFCSVNKVALVIRSHECVPEGYAVLHGGRLITLFSASKYCGTQMNKGAFCSLKADCRPEIQQFIAPPLHTYSRVKPMFPQYNSVGGDLHLAPEAVNEADMSADTTMHASLEEDSLRMIAERICEHKSDLFRYFTQHEHAARNGRVSRLVWADALKAELKLDLPFLLYQSKPVDVEADNTINYSKHFRSLTRTQVGR